MHALALLPLLFAADPAVRSEPVEHKTDAGALHGTLDLPPGDGPWPVVLIHPGSGPTDRDGNQPKMTNNSLKYLGQALAGKGIACLRIDKRGVGGSAKVLGKEKDLRLDHYAEDVAAWVEFLRADKRFTKVGFIGHSEGALIGLLAGQTVTFDAFVSLCGPGRRLSDILRTQLKGKVSDELYEKSEAILKTLEAGKTTDDVPKELAALYRPSVQPYLISMFQHDPADLVKKLDCPVLVVTGTTDIQVPGSEGERLAGAKEGIKHVSIEDMTHVLKEAETTNPLAQQLTVYTDPKRPLHPELADVLTGFLRPALGAKK